MGRILGLDIGPNSIGWAILEDENGHPQLVDAGVRVFPEGVDNFDTSKEESRNMSRRDARAVRRQVLRRKRRRLQLRRALTQAGLLPADRTELEALLGEDPYVLRAKALKEKLTPYQIGRVMLHLNQRRGFLSNRKKDRKDNEVKGMLQEISALAADMNGRTLGEYLAARAAKPGQKATSEHRLRGRHTRRDMLAEEFDQIWKNQAKYHPELLTESLRHGAAGPLAQVHRPIRLPRGSDLLKQFGIEGILFFQRPMYWPKSVVGVCELEPREKRCPRADRAAQRFRLLQEVNNLRYIDPDSHEEKSLTAEQRKLVLEKLAAKEKLTFDEVRKALGFLESVHFNLERGERSSLGGMKTDVQMAKAVGKQWHRRPGAERDEIVRLLLRSDLGEAETAARESLINRHGFTPEEAETLLSVDLPDGYASLSLKAINKLLPYLEQGMRYMAESDPAQSAMHAAGYCRPDEIRRRLFDQLPTLQQIHSGPLSDLPNPVVKAALYELRKVVNAIIREYGKPDAIHVEMARELKMPRKKRQEYNSRIREREAERGEAAAYLREKGVKVSREAILRYLLWKQQGEYCIYTGDPISFCQLFNGEVDIDHILPFSQTLDDSQDNKVVAFRGANAEKGQRTPRQWLENDPKRYEEVCQRARRLGYRKYRRFLQKELELDDFVARQLRDTAYIARLAGEYLKLLVEPRQVLGLKGQHTATLRHHWGLETLISELPDSPAWAEQAKLLPGEKNRADHRHHALDAIVVALTNRSRLQHLARIGRQGGTETTGEILPEPMPDFRSTVSGKLRSIHVSHRPRRQVSGKLHEDTLYGQTDQPGRFVVRKPVEALSANEIDRIRDEGIKRLVVARLKEHGIDFGRGKKPAAGAIGKALAGLVMPSGVPVKKVRVLKVDSTIRPIRKETFPAYVKPGSLHHLCIFEWDQNGKRMRDIRFVSMLEAAARIRDCQPIISRRHPDRSDARFVMSLSAGEVVFANIDNQKKLLIFRTAPSTSGQLRFSDHTDARKSNSCKIYTATAGTLDARKVSVDPLGRIRWAND